jgi:hypothetical protein
VPRIATWPAWSDVRTVVSPSMSTATRSPSPAADWLRTIIQSPFVMGESIGISPVTLRRRNTPSSSRHVGLPWLGCGGRCGADCSGRSRALLRRAGGWKVVLPYGRAPDGRTAPVDILVVSPGLTLAVTRYMAISQIASDVAGDRDVWRAPFKGRTVGKRSVTIGPPSPQAGIRCRTN